VPRKDAQRESSIVAGPSAAALPGPGSLSLTPDERTVVELLVTCGVSRTVTQIAAECGLSRADVVGALEGLRTKGLVTRLNTLVDSYAARFPGLEV